MKKLNFLGVLIITLCFVHNSYAQEELTKEVCDQRAESILKYKETLKDYPPELIDKIIDFIEPCTTRELESQASKYIAGVLMLLSDDNQIQHTGHNLISFASAHGYVPAKFDMAFIYLRGGHNLRFHPVKYSRAENEFRGLIDYHNYETDLAHYINGYINMKHFPTAQGSNYDKAKNHFEQSNHPMAKHWLAIMYYFGYGVEKDEEKALQMLSENDIYNSKVLLDFLPTQNNDWLPVSAEVLSILDTHYPSYYPDDYNEFKGAYHGRMYQYDWSNKGGVIRDTPVSFTIGLANNRRVTYSVTANENTFSSECDISRASLLFRDQPMQITLKRLHQDHRDKDTITYAASQLDFYETTLNGERVLIGRALGNILDWNEKAPRLQFIVKKENSTPLRVSGKDDKSSTTLLKHSFATVSPNPIGNQFNITYTLDQAAETQVSVYDLFGQQKISLPSQGHTTAGTQTITIDSAALPSGTYVIQMTVDGQPYSKMVIKE